MKPAILILGGSVVAVGLLFAWSAFASEGDPAAAQTAQAAKQAQEKQAAANAASGDAAAAHSADLAIDAILAAAVAALSASSPPLIGAAYAAPAGASVAALWHSMPTDKRAQVWRGQL